MLKHSIDSEQCSEPNKLHKFCRIVHALIMHIVNEVGCERSHFKCQNCHFVSYSLVKTVVKVFCLITFTSPPNITFLLRKKEEEQ